MVSNYFTKLTDKEIFFNCFKFSKFYKIFKNIKYRYISKLFYYPLSFDDKNFQMIDYGLNARPSIALKLKKVLKFQKNYQ